MSISAFVLPIFYEQVLPLVPKPLMTILGYSLLVLGIIILALILIVPLVFKKKRNQVQGTQQILTMMILGSGGHTAEMLAVTKHLDRARFAPRIYVSAVTDKGSEDRAKRQEELCARNMFQRDRSPESKNLADDVAAASAASAAAAAAVNDEDDDYGKSAQYFRIPRAREVGQSWASSVWTTLRALMASGLLLWRIQPQLLLCNGPGTGLPMCFAAWIGRVVFGWPCKIVFVESFCRVQSLSLTGLILYWLRLTDRFIVMWPQLLPKFPRAELPSQLLL